MKIQLTQDHLENDHQNRVVVTVVKNVLFFMTLQLICGER